MAAILQSLPQGVYEAIKPFSSRNTNAVALIYYGIFCKNTFKLFYEFLECYLEGFQEAITDASQLPQDMLAQICQDVATFLQYKSGPVKAEKYTQLLEASSASPTKVSMTSVVNALTYILRSAAALKLDGEEFQNQLVSSDIFTKDVLDTLVHTWREQGRQLMETTSQLQCLNVGQLLDLQWRVGVAISSDDCKSLNSPIITLLLTIAETGGSITKHSVEMTLTQFRNFSRQLKEMAVLIETV